MKSGNSESSIFESIEALFAKIQTVQDDKQLVDLLRELMGITQQLPENEQIKVSQQALDIAQKIKKNYSRAQALAVIAPQLPENERRQILEQALDSAQEIENEYERALALAEIAPQLPATEPQLLEQALNIAQSIDQPYFRTLAIAEIAPHLPETERRQVLEEALKSAREIKFKPERAEADAVIAPHLPETQRRQVLENALYIAEQINGEESRADTLAAIALQLPETEPQLLEQALYIAENINSEASRAEALAAIATQLPATELQLLEQALYIANEIQYEEPLSKALTAIASQLPETETQLLKQALDSAQNIRDEDYRTEALAAIASQLPENETQLLEQAMNAALAIDSEKGRVKILVRLKLPANLLEPARSSVLEKSWEEAAQQYKQEEDQKYKSEPEQGIDYKTIDIDLIAQSFKNDAAEGEDLLGIKDEVHALAEVLVMRDLKPPLAVGVLGGWGSGKSFVMHLMREKLNEIYQDPMSEKQAWNRNKDKESPYVGHIYQIYFNSWTYAKLDLWSSLMQTIFYELNYQLTIEKHLRDTFAIHKAVSELISKISSSKDFLTFKDCLEKNKETRPLLKIFQPDFWEKCKQYNQEKQKPSDWENLNWNKLKKDIDGVIGNNTTENCKALTCKELYTIWEEAQKDAMKQICEVGKVWDILDSKLTAEQRDILIKQHFQHFRNKFDEQLDQKLFFIWQKIIATSRTQGVIWNELSDLRHLDRQELALIERDLSAAEKELESKQQINKLSAQKKLEREKTFIIWKPIRDKLYNLLGIDSEQVRNTKDLFNQIRNSPRSYIALACLITLIILGASPSWSERMQILEVVIKSHINTAKVWLIEIYNQYWFFSVPVTGALLQKIWSVSKQYLTEVKQEQIRLENKYQEWVQQAQEEQEILDLSRNIESLRLQAEQKRRQVGLIANQSSLLDFVNNRLQEGSYGQRLGLIHQISHDLEDLSKRLDFTDKDLFSENGKYIRNLFPRGPARVILYIDDLDRCPPDRVVDVLEAVQLLLKTPLFVVVLAIDDRYIARALEKAYEGVLKRKGHPSGIDYLEKIIQIPYRTRPISGSKVEQYLKEHIQIETEIETEIKDSTSTNDLNIEKDDELSPLKAPIETPTTLEKEDKLLQFEASENTQRVEPPPPTVAKFTKAEFRILTDYCKEVDLSPRTAKRLINIYKILKILWYRSKKLEQNHDAETIENIKKSVLAMLVLSGRYPSFMREVFAEISRFYEERQYKKDDQKENLKLYWYFSYPLNYLNNIKDPHLQRERKKFNHDVKTLIDPLDITLLKLEETNFNLALSFCFVGDIGYDPEDYHIDKLQGEKLSHGEKMPESLTYYLKNIR